MREPGEGEYHEALDEVRRTRGEPRYREQRSAALKRLRLAADRYVIAHMAYERLVNDDDGGSATLIPG